MRRICARGGHPWDVRRNGTAGTRGRCHNLRMKLHRLAATALLVLGLNAHGQSQGIPESGIPESKDAYHFLYWLATTQPGSYTEWWYFNVYDTSNNVQAIFSYLV